MEVKVRDGQTLADIAVQEYGAIEALPALALANGRSMTGTLRAGDVLTLPDKVYNRLMRGYCKAHDVRPATQRDRSDETLLRIFTKEFTKEFS